MHCLLACLLVVYRRIKQVTTTSLHEWTAEDDNELLDRIENFDADCESDIQWVRLVEGTRWSPQQYSDRWRALLRKAKPAAELSLDERLALLRQMVQNEHHRLPD